MQLPGKKHARMKPFGKKHAQMKPFGKDLAKMKPLGKFITPQRTDAALRHEKWRR